MPALLRLHAALRASPWLRRFTAATRLAIAVGFIPSGWTKVLGHRFTTLGTDTTVGFFFEAFYQNQVWYRVVGVAQVLSAILLFMPRTAHLGTLLFLPIIFNIWLVTVGAHFQGTWVITSLMLLANLWLVAWEWDRVSALLAVPRGSPAVSEPTRPWLGAGAALGLLGFGLLWAGNIALVRTTPGLLGFPVAAGAGAVGGAVVAWHIRRMPA
ncbi:MAG: DoxX family protein [Gemmatimonadetes bacterium]|nr:DoxX family protein [Gemmatimonadota bacterium]